MWAVKAAMERGQPVPAWYIDRPFEHESDEFYISAFRALSTCRSFGLGVGPIPWTAIDAYAARFGMSDDMADHLNIVITAMDNVYLKHVDDEQKASKNKG